MNQKLRITIGLLALASVACESENEPAGSGENDAVKMLDPSETHYGKTYAEWSVDWWQWFYAQPGTNHPVLDVTGEACTLGQDPDSEVFFLIGTNGGEVERSCSFPPDKAIFFPVINISVDNAGVDPSDQSSDDQLEAAANAYVDSVVEEDLAASVDGHAVSDVPSGLVPPTRFSYVVPDGDSIYTISGVDGVSGTVDPSFTAGYWVLLAPLAAGEHHVEFSGRTDATPDFRVSATYHLTLD